MSELKPCPFCGELPELFDKPCYYYQCVKERCQGQEVSWNNTIEEALASWNTRPIEEALQARIAELELILAADKLIEDGWIGRIEAGDKRIAELEATLDKAAHQLYDYSGSCPSDLYDWEHPNTCIRECDRYDNPDEAWKCWRLWLLEKPREEQ